jgi:hypothetical protein
VGAAQDLASRVSLANRRRKLSLFLRELRPTAATSVLDVGVSDGGFGAGAGSARAHNFFEALYPWPERITAVSTQYLERFGEAFPQVRRVRADGRELPFADGEFDVGFSNAVIEHELGREEQRRFVHELCRVSRRVFVTTPNRLFPVEVHTLLPLVHWLPRGLRDPVYRASGRREGLEVELLAPRSFLSLFPPEVETRVVARWPAIVVVGERRPAADARV